MSLRGRPGTLRDSHARSVRGEGGSRWFASMVGVAQLVRAPGCGPGGRGFESPRSPHRIVPWATPAPLAQLVEHRTLNPQVLGSSPRGCTKEIPGVSLGFRRFYRKRFLVQLRAWLQQGHIHVQMVNLATRLEAHRDNPV